MKTIETPSGKMIPVHTPGHAKDHTVFFLPEKGVLFSGDLYLADYIKFFRSDENMGIQIESLKKVTHLDFNTLLFGHNPRLYGNIVYLWKKGFPEKQIFNKLKLKEAWFTKYFCFGNVSHQMDIDMPGITGNKDSEIIKQFIKFNGYDFRHTLAND